MNSKQPAASASQPSLSEQVQVRLDKRARLIGQGREPYPVETPRTHSLAEVRERWGGLTAGEETDDVVAVAGRVMFQRNTGKLCFATLADQFTPDGEGGRLQVMLSLGEVGAESLQAWKDDVDLGDFVSVTGRVISSRRGELSVMATGWSRASKAVRPLPNLHADLSEESRVRQRYADLIVREESRAMVRTRAAITRSIRETMHRLGFLEVETPTLQLVHGGAAARPFNTHLNAFDIDMSLRIALELHLKRAMVGGTDRVYEMGRIFRNEGIDSSHSAEFTMLECYQAWTDQRGIAETMRQVILDAADAVGSRRIETPAGVIDLDAEWRWLPVYDGLSEKVGREVSIDTPVEEMRAIADEHGVEYDEGWGSDKLAVELFGELVEPGLLQPTFVCDYPAIAQPLARPHRSKPGLIEAWDLIIGGMERGTGFSELIDPVVQRERLTEQSRKAAHGDEEAMELDEDFLRALEFGAPPMGGLGMGVDRVIMLFTNAGIRETILFPLLKPEG